MRRRHQYYDYYGRRHYRAQGGTTTSRGAAGARFPSGAPWSCCWRWRRWWYSPLWPETWPAAGHGVPSPASRSASTVRFSQCQPGSRTESAAPSTLAHTARSSHGAIGSGDRARTASGAFSRVGRPGDGPHPRPWRSRSTMPVPRRWRCSS